MVNQGLVDYLKEGKRRGFTVARLKQELIKGGFNFDEIDNAVDYISEETIKPKITPVIRQTPTFPIQVKNAPVVQGQKSGKGWIIFLIILLIILVGGAIASYIYRDWIIGLF